MNRWHRFRRLLKIMFHAAQFAWRSRHADTIVVRSEAYTIEPEPSLDDEWAQAQRELHE